MVNIFSPFRRSACLGTNILTTTLLSAVFMLLPAGAVAAGSMVVGDGLILNCAQPEPVTLRCNFHLTGNGQPLTASASINDISLTNPTFAVRSGAPDSVAVLLLVDTSDPARENVIKKIRGHIERLINEAEPHLRFGLASFDSELEILAPIGSDIDSIIATVNTLSAKGHTTELYRNVVNALDLLATTTDENKVLVVLSDGLAEDRAYFHADAVRTALENRISIHSIGYARSVALSVGLQSLRRLADETGGRFIAADSSLNLPEDFFPAAFSIGENIGALSVDLTSATEVLASGNHDLHVVMETNAGPARAVVPVTLPPSVVAEPVVKVVEIEVPRVIEVEKIVRVPQSAAAPALDTSADSANTHQSGGVPLWSWVIAIALLALALLVLLLVLLFQRRSTVLPSIVTSATPPPVSMEGLAYLILEQDEDQHPHPINSMTYRIGRMEDNDLVIRDPSVSRHHAEIRRHRDGSFQVLDLDSMNGVFVNGKKITEAALNQNDDLDVGDVRMRFNAENVDESAGEETVMLRTAMPDQPFPDVASTTTRR